MMHTKTNLPAFPSAQYASGVSPTGHNEGMTLRDYFAAKAMQANVEILSRASLPDWNAEVARLSYLLADAMLKAREVGHE